MRDELVLLAGLVREVWRLGVERMRGTR